MSQVKIYDAAALSCDEWRDLQGISREAFANTLKNRSQAEIDALVEWDSPELFCESHIDPNSQVGKRYNAHQSYAKPRVAVATNAGEAVGFAFSAHNVSGATERERSLKRLSVVKNYLWLREIAVKPAFQMRGIARELGRSLLKDAVPLQPPTTYVWPDEAGFIYESLKQLGFKYTGEQNVSLFGEGSDLTRQVRMQASSAYSVLRCLSSKAEKYKR